VIAVVVPAHDEEILLGPCLDALACAAAHPSLRGEGVEVVVVADTCSDATGAIAAARGARVVEVAARNVGIARAAGAQEAVRRGARWLAFTDADSEVAPCWLARQLALGADAVCGVVTVGDWQEHPPAVRRAYQAHYRDVEHHPHVHGASLGVATGAYLRAGGFPPLRSREDVALVARLVASGATVARSNTVRVRTSARRVGRAPDGFAGFLGGLCEGG